MPTVAGETDPLLPVDDLNVKVSDHVVFDNNGEPDLLGGHCKSCGVRFFPGRSTCPKCTSSHVDTVALPRKGELYTFSTIHVSSTRKVPYHLGYIDLPGDVRLLSELKPQQNDAIQSPFEIGDTMELQAADGEWFFTKSGEGA